MKLEQLKCDIENNLSLRDMSTKYGKSITAIRYWIFKFGLKTKNSSFIKGHKCFEKKKFNKIGSKYMNMDWIGIQSMYDNGKTLKDLNKIGIHNVSIEWARKNGLFKSKSISEAVKISKKSIKKPILDLSEKKNYKKACKFDFDLKSFKDEFDFSLIEKFGWYKARNRGNNLNGVSRDHMYSIDEGYKNNIDPKIISHPSNCKLLRHSDNLNKNSDCSVTLDELKTRIDEWNEKYKI